jgi:arylsulfatase A-like enzyme
MKRAGYTTAVIGKWGLGGPGSSGEPNRMGFDHFFGFLCQRLAHNYYPPHLWRNGRKVPLDNPLFSAHQKLPDGADPNDAKSYAAYSGRQYAPDLMADEAEAFIRAHRDGPFFLNLTFTNPHVALQVPEDSLAEYLGAFPEKPYTGSDGYLPHRAPRAAYAAMITRLDSYVGRMSALLRELGIEERTLVIFSSDNGPTFPTGGVDTAFFESSGGLRGAKRDVFEGGIRVPFIARWPGRIRPGTVSDVPCAFWDLVPTFAELGGTTAPPKLDGVSLLPVLTGRPGSRLNRQYLYWEFSGHQAVQLTGRTGGPRWKGIRLAKSPATELYDLAADPAEQRNVAAGHPEVVARIEEIFRTGRTESALFPLGR